MNRVAKQGDTNHGAIDTRIQNEKPVIRLVIGEMAREKRFGNGGEAETGLLIGRFEAARGHDIIAQLSRSWTVAWETTFFGLTPPVRRRIVRIRD
jgi:hypothetical protein